MAERAKSKVEQSTDQQLSILYSLQTADSKIDAIRALRGELPLEVEDLEDEIEGLNTRLANFETQYNESLGVITDRKQEIKDAEALIKKYSEQQKNVRNNREYDAFSKELEYQKLEIELRNKQIREAKARSEELEQVVQQTRERIQERKLDLEAKRVELGEIIGETEKEEAKLLKESTKLLNKLPERLGNGYTRIRANARNGLAVVPIERGACGGCFNRIPPQRQLDIRMRKKLIVCEYCGRIIVDIPQEEDAD